jgi:hypothetical protein
MNTGTRGRFRSWLASVKNMTYSKYSTLKVEEKVAIQKEYRGVK